LMQSVSEQKITNVVFMGMGEPLLNYDAVVFAVNKLRERALKWARITVSTVGIPDKIRQLGKDTQCQLAISLHAPNDNIRNKLVPINQRYPIKEVLSACKEFPFSRHGPLMIEYILIDGINDKLEHAKELAELLRPFKYIVINLILCNPVVFSPPSAEIAKTFKQALIDAGYKTIIRTTKGVDIGAACGMLATKKILKAV